MLFDRPLPPPDPLRAAVRTALRMDETACVEARLAAADLPPGTLQRIAARARALVERVRGDRVRHGSIDAFLHEYGLSTPEGVVLMCLAEALLRIPDARTRDRLIRDKIGGAEWERHLGTSESLLVNASTWALMLTGRLIRPSGAADFGATLRRLMASGGGPLIRQAMVQAMRIMGRQFVMGETIGEALERAEADAAQGYRHSFDMLGEAARTMADAERYFAAYVAAIEAIGAASPGRGPIESPGISVKLSALHPRYEFAQRERVLAELVPRLGALARLAREADIGLTVDAEEADRLDLSLDVVGAVFRDGGLAGWEGFGLAVQAYQKAALPLLDWLAEMAGSARRRLMVRLVKGAYWDTEIKRTQEAGLDAYPVFTRKASTDVSYLACARRLAEAGRIYPQFATHNAHTVAAVEMIMADRGAFEFQRLHGMGEALYDGIVAERPCRVYAPVGSHRDLLAYLVRRLLENGANTSFVNRIVDDAQPVEAIVADPIARTRLREPKPHPQIPLPRNLFGDERRNSSGIDLSAADVLAALDADLSRSVEAFCRAAPVIGGREASGKARAARDPADRRRVIGEVVDAAPADIDAALERAAGAAEPWNARGGAARAALLERAADLYEADRATLMALAIREGGKTLPDAVAEVREAVDFLRYYAARARREFATPVALPGPTGEVNELALQGRGVFVCISPWNFPLAIFTGQVAAALAAGNAVIAKPAEQTSLIAHRAVGLLHRAGIPGDVLHLVIGEGSAVGPRLVADPRAAGVAFTGSTDTARAIHRALAARDGPIATLIAETGGQNAMIVDSSALPEQVVRDVLTSAFQSAGQRCSALRMLYVQEDIADAVIVMLCGAVAELRVGDPGLLRTDVGPVIDAAAREMLAGHAARMEREGRLLAIAPDTEETAHGTFFRPMAFEIDSIGRLHREVFGPILHVGRFAGDDLDRVIDDINATGYGLTFSLHSRIDSTVERVRRRVAAGNVYVNRNQIGAVVGVQPFGGLGLSGTGPKAGGPRYLHRFATERAVTIDMTAAGGNAALLSLEPEDT